MTPRLFRLLIATVLFGALGGCSTLDSLNPFASSGPKMAVLQPFKPSAEARVAWQLSISRSEDYALTPAIVGTTVYAAGKDGTLVRIDEGKTVWKVSAGQVLSGGVGANRNMLVVGSAKGDVLAFSSEDGKPLWKARASSEILSPPAIGDGVVVVRSGDNRLHAYDLAEGKRKWIYQRPIPALSLRVTASPLIDDKYVFTGFPGGKMIAVSVANGAALWDGTVALPKGATETDRASDVTSSPVISGQTICAVAFQGRVACFDLRTGNLMWARDMSSSAGLAVDGRYLYVTDDKGAIHALDMASGASIWKQDKLFMRRVTAPLPRRSLVAVADVQGVVHFLNREDGSFAARLNTDGSPVIAPLQAMGNRVLLQTSKGGIYAIEIE